MKSSFRLMRPLTNWTGSDLKCNLIQSFWRCVHTHTCHLGIFLKGRFRLSSPGWGLNFCISDKLPRNAILWVTTKALLFHFLSWPWHWTICWFGLPFWESFLILGLVNNLGDGCSLTILGRRLCVFGRRVSLWLEAPSSLTLAGLLLYVCDSILPKTVFTFFTKFFFWFCWLLWNSMSLSLDDSSLGTNTFCFTKLVDTALCHLNKGKIICVKEIEKLKMKHWNHENQLQMWTNYTVQKKKTKDQASNPKQLHDILLLNSRSAFWPLSHLILRAGSLYYYLQFTNE